MFGQIVTYYRHEAANDVHTTTDYPAIVYADHGNDCVSLVIFGDGAPARTERVCKFSPDAITKLQPADRAVGLPYWRDVGSDAPDFGTVFNEPAPPLETLDEKHNREVAELDARQALERENASGKDGLEAKHAREDAEVEKRYEDAKATGAYPNPGQPAPIPPAALLAPKIPPTVDKSLPKI